MYTKPVASIERLHGLAACDSAGDGVAVAQCSYVQVYQSKTPERDSIVGSDDRMFPGPRRFNSVIYTVVTLIDFFYMVKINEMTLTDERGRN